MTLEEKAKKLASSVPLREDIPFQDYLRVQLASMYYTGAVENGIIWHDLLKNPDDLPTDKHFKITSDGDIALYDCFLGKWYDLRSDELTYHPAAWCEIPEFKGGGR